MGSRRIARGGLLPLRTDPFSRREDRDGTVVIGTVNGQRSSDYALSFAGGNAHCWGIITFLFWKVLFL
jgi:hypothetical protein